MWQKIKSQIHRIDRLSIRFVIMLLICFAPFTTYATKTIKTGIPATFSTDAKGDSFEWVFPDDEVLSGKSVQYTFYEAGTYTITLNTERNGQVLAVKKTIRVQNFGKPTALTSITVEGTPVTNMDHIKVNQGESITFDSLAVDSLGESGNMNETWWVNGKAYKKESLPFLFDEPGTYTGKLIVSEKNNANLRDETTFSIDVLNVPPVVTAVNFKKDPKFGNKRVSVSVEIEGKNETIKQYQFEILEDNEVVLRQVSQNNSAFFNLDQFPGKHLYFAKATVLDKWGGRTTAEGKEPLETEGNTDNTPPEATIVVSPGVSGTTETEFAFSVEASDADNDSLRYKWQLADGQIKQNKDFNYTFSSPGTYTIKMEASDGLATASDSIDIVIGAGETYENKKPIVKIKGVLPSTGGNTETIFRFYADISDPDNDTVKPHWEMGDGHIFDIKNVSYRFSKPGTYKVKLTGSDGKLEANDIITLKVVAVGEKIPENSNDNDTDSISIPVATVPLELAINTNGKTKVTTDPFNPTLEAILNSEKSNYETQLAAETDPKRKQSLKEKIKNIDKKIVQIKTDPFSLRGETKEGCIALLKKERDAKIKAFSLLKKDDPLREKMKSNIVRLNLQLKDPSICTKNENLVEGVLLISKKERQKKLKIETDPAIRKRLVEEIEIIDRELAKLRGNPLLKNTQEAKFLLEDLLLQKNKALAFAKTNEDRARLQQEIDQLENKISDIEKNPDEEETLVPDLEGTTDTKFFFYGNLKTQTEQAIFFEWELSKDLRIPGQNINIRYKTPGFYRVMLRVSDGNSIVSDSIIIKIVEKQKN